MPLLLPQFTAFREFLGISTGRGNSGSAHWTPWDEDKVVRIWRHHGSRSLWERGTERRGTGQLKGIISERCRVSFNYSTDWSAQAREKTAWDQGKTSEVRDYNVWCSHRSRNSVPLPTHKMENIMAQGPVSIVLRRALSQSQKLSLPWAWLQAHFTKLKNNA